ncbi:MAG: ABC transporter substrate-binding protein [Acidobacteriota bacterium]
MSSILLEEPQETLDDEDPAVKYCPLCGKEYAEGEVCPGDGAVLVHTQQESDPLIGTVLKGTYRIEEQIGAGGMGAVFRAVQTPLDRDVAVKILLPSAQSTPSMISRFFQEARLLSQLSHPNVVGIIDFGNTETGMIFMVMEYLTGQTLSALVPEKQGLPMADAVHWMHQACAGVSAAHRNDLVHRDLKPENLFIASSRSGPDTLKVLDFGIARTLEGAEGTRLTQMGLLMGTPGFIAPEQIESPAEAGARSDIYALGAILFFMVTGHRPYYGQTPHSVLVQQMQRPPQLDLGLLAEQPAVAAVIAKAMAIAPENRFASTDELVEALDSAVGGPDSAVPPTLVSAAASSPAGGPSVAPTLLNEKTAAPARGAGGWRRWLVPAVLALILLAGGFLWWRGGANDAADSAAGTVAAEDLRGVTDSRIAIGMSAAFSGPARELGRGMQTGIETYFREINADGGVHGRDLELIALDDAYEPDRAVANMIELLHQRDVFAILGNVGTPTAAVTVPLAVEQGVPFFGAFSGADLLRRDPPDRYVFNYRASYAEETAALVDYFLEDLGFEPSEIAVFAQDDGYGDAGYEGVRSALAARGYEGSVLRVGYRRNSLELDGAVEGIQRRRAAVSAIVMAATYRPAAEFIRRLVDDGIEPVFANLSFVGSRALAEELAGFGPRYAEGVIVSQVVPHPESAEPGVARYREHLARHFPSEQPGFVSLEGYLAAQVFAEALRSGADPPTIEEFLTAVQSLDYDAEIGAGLAFGPDRHQASSKVWGTMIDASGRYVELDL